jgi:hypothetical protein
MRPGAPVKLDVTGSVAPDIPLPDRNTVSKHKVVLDITSSAHSPEFWEAWRQPAGDEVGIGGIPDVPIHEDIRVPESGPDKGTVPFKLKVAYLDVIVQSGKISSGLVFGGDFAAKIQDPSIQGQPLAPCPSIRR